MAKLTIADKTGVLVFDMTSWEEMEETVGTLDKIDELMEGRERLKNGLRVLDIFTKEGARLGKGEHLKADWLKENMKPWQTRLMWPAIREAITEGFRMETKQGDSEVIDPVLAELEKKEEKDA